METIVLASEISAIMKNNHYNDCYFSDQDGLDESLYVFIDGNDIPRRCTDGQLHIGETGYGTGLNLLCLIETLRNTETSPPVLKYTSIEKYPLETGRIRELLSSFADRLGSGLDLYLQHWEVFHKSLTPGWNHTLWDFPGLAVEFSLYYGDAGQWCGDPLPEDVDAWFLDGHSPEINPDIWSPEVMASVYRKTVPGGTLASFTASGKVKKPLRDAGFTIKRRKGFASKRHMIQGFKA